MLRDWTDSLKFDGLSAEAERLFTRLLMKADDFGRYHANPRLLKSGCFPLAEDLRANTVAAWLTELSDRQLVFCYTSGTVEYLAIYNYGQRLRQARAKFPQPTGKPPGWMATCGDSPELAAESRDMRPDLDLDSDLDLEDLTHTGGESLKTEASGTRETFLTGKTPEFAEFWGAYPRLAKPELAWTTWQAVVWKLVSERNWTDARAAEHLIAAAREYAASPSGKAPSSGQDYRPFASNWLKDGSYDEPRSEWQRQNSKPASTNGHAPKRPKVKPLPEYPELGDDLLKMVMK